jgi:hypothetical protein
MCAYVSIVELLRVSTVNVYVFDSMHVMHPCFKPSSSLWSKSNVDGTSAWPERIAKRVVLMKYQNWNYQRHVLSNEIVDTDKTDRSLCVCVCYIYMYVYVYAYHETYTIRY